MREKKEKLLAYARGEEILGIDPGELAEEVEMAYSMEISKFFTPLSTSTEERIIIEAQRLYEKVFNEGFGIEALQYLGGSRISREIIKSSWEWEKGVEEALNTTLFKYGYRYEDIQGKSKEEKVALLLRREGRYKTARKKGVARPDLASLVNIDPEAFAIVDEMAAEAGFRPWGPREEGPYDSYGVWGLSPQEIADAWYASGCKANGKFRVWIDFSLSVLKKDGRMDETYLPAPKKNISSSKYFYLLRAYKSIGKFKNFNTLGRGDQIRLGRLSWPARYYAAKNCIVVMSEGDTDGRIRAKVDWAKLSEWLKLPKRVRAKSLPFKAAWRLLFNREAPLGLGDGDGGSDPHPTILSGDRVRIKAFRALMEVVKKDSPNESALKANTRAAYHLVAAFRDLATIKRWVKKVSGEYTPTALEIHDAFINANKIISLENSSAWLKMLLQFPELRWHIGFAQAFEEEFKRAPRGKTEFMEFVNSLYYEGVQIPEVAQIAASLSLNEEDFKDYENFFLTNPPKASTELPSIEIEEGGYVFKKLYDHDFRGPFLGLYTDCCQHLHNAGSDCAKAGWIQAESGFYVVEKNGKIVAQSWAWRGQGGELVFDSIEGLGQVNVEAVASLYKKAAEGLLGKLGITRVLVGDTDYGLTPEIRDIIGGKNVMEPARMKAYVSYTDAERQWLLAE